MPIYEYECTDCGQFELIQKITEDAIQECPTCKKKVKRLMSNTAFHLKGTGWYKTDYGSSSSNTGASQSASKNESKPKAEVAKSSDTSSSSE